jgi:hypothetical protein
LQGELQRIQGTPEAWGLIAGLAGHEVSPGSLFVIIWEGGGLELMNRIRTFGSFRLILPKSRFLGIGTSAMRFEKEEEGS